jgi:hypothetical protein
VPNLASRMLQVLNPRKSAIIKPPTPTESPKMAFNVIQLIEKSVELGTALEVGIIEAEASLAAGLPVAVPAITIKIGGHTYSVSVSFSKVS